MSNSEPLPFGGLLLRYRAAARVTQEQLASRACLSPDTIAALERGRRKAPHAGTVACLADALGLEEQERAQLVAAAHGTGYTGTTRAIGRRRAVAVEEPGGDAASAAREAARARHRPSWRLTGQPTRALPRYITHPSSSLPRCYECANGGCGRHAARLCW
jgi:transcriptional regulator with XRE-family HTH domain